MEANQQGAIKRVAHSLVDAIQGGRAAAVFVRCEDSRAVDEARTALMSASRRVRWIDVALNEADDPITTLASAAQGDRTIFLCTQVSDHSMRRLHLDVNRFDSMRLRCVFLLPAGQITLFARVGKGVWERRALYLAWPPRTPDPAVARSAENHRAAPPMDVEVGGAGSGGSPIRRRIEAALAIQERRVRGNAVLVACRDAYHASDLRLADEYLMGALRDLRDEGSEEELAEALQLAGALEEARGDLQRALEWYVEARKHWESCEVPLGLATIYARLGSLHFVRGELTDANRYLERGLEYEESLGSPARMADAHRLMGMLRERQGLVDEAEKHLKKSLQMAEELGEAVRVGRAQHHLGHLAERQDRFNDARTYYEAALRIREQARDWRGMAATLHQLGNVYYHRAEYPQAIQSYEQAIDIETRLRDEPGLAATLLQLAHVSEERFQHTTATRCLLQARPLLRKLHSPLLPEVEARLERMSAMLSPADMRKLQEEVQARGVPDPAAAAARADAQAARPPQLTKSAPEPAVPEAKSVRRRPVAAPKSTPTGPVTDEELQGFRDLLGDDG